MQLTSQQFIDAFLATLVISAVFVVALMVTFAASAKNGRWARRGRWQYRFTYYNGADAVNFYCTALSEADAYSQYYRSFRAPHGGPSVNTPEPAEIARRWVRTTRHQLENVAPPPSAGGASPRGGREGVDALPPAGHVPCAPGAQCLGSVPPQVKASRQIGKTVCCAGFFLVALLSPLSVQAAVVRSYAGTGNSVTGSSSAGTGTVTMAFNASTMVCTVTFVSSVTSPQAGTVPSTSYVFNRTVQGLVRLNNGSHDDSSGANGTVLANWSQTTSGTVSTTFSYTTGQWYRLEVRAIYDTDDPTGSLDDVTQTYRDTQGGAATEKNWQTSVSYYNDREYPVTMKLMKNGVEVGQYTVNAKTLFGHTFQDTAEERPEYQVFVQKDGLAFSEGNWSLAPTGTVFTAWEGTIAPSKVTETPPGTPPTSANTTTIPSAINLPAAMPTAPSVSNVWRTATATGNSTYTGPTDATFREGVGKITERQDQQIAAEKEKKTAADADKKAWQDNQKQSDWEAKLTEKINAGKAAVTDNISGGGVTTPDVATPGGSAWDIPIGNTTVNIYPTGNVLTGMHIVRVFMQAILIYWWIYYMQGECRSVLRSVGLAPQARGNTVAGTGGQVTALLSATVITIALLGVPVAMAALTDNGIGWRQTVNLFGAFTDGTGGTIASMSWQLVCECFPVLTFVTILNNVIIFKAAGTAIMYGVMIAVRWIVPALVGLLAFHHHESDAAVRWHNQTSEAVLVEQVRGLWTSTVPAESFAELPPQGGSQYRVVTSAGVKTPVEALDEAEVYLMPDGTVFTSHPTASWLTYVWRGFVVGMLWNIGGYFFRRFAAMGGSLEAAS